MSHPRRDADPANPSRAAVYGCTGSDSTQAAAPITRHTSAMMSTLTTRLTCMLYCPTDRAIPMNEITLVSPAMNATDEGGLRSAADGVGSA
jgi:hypothetical protein